MSVKGFRKQQKVENNATRATGQLLEVLDDYIKSLEANSLELYNLHEIMMSANLNDRQKAQVSKLLQNSIDSSNKLLEQLED